MANGRNGQIWTAEPHTIAKIAILKGYLNAWLPIFGRSQVGRELLYVDGFAGPGHYSNSSEGSPIAALVAAKLALAKGGDSWRAGKIHCAFIEAAQSTAQHLDHHLQPFLCDPRLTVSVLPMTFETGIANLKQTHPGAFEGTQPLLVFVDPFGATGVPFSAINDILDSPRSEVLINFDADGFARILQAGEAANAQVLMTKAFGDDSWKVAMNPFIPFRERVMTLLDLYKRRLRSLARVEYVYAFEMRTATKSVGQCGYFLVFACQHSLGLERMKESMKSVGQNGDYRFSNALVGRPLLFRSDDPAQFSDSLSSIFLGKGPVPYATVRDFALTETPFSNPKIMLRVLDKLNRLRVVSSDPKRRKGTFDDKKTRTIEFLEGPSDG
jgi:three-Cys-motif partner protein